MLVGVLESAILVILTLSVLVIIHELGHFLVAKWAKIKVEEFGLGYPPKIKTLFRLFGTEFTLNMIPFGGFVRMTGENSSDLKAKERLLPGEFYYASKVKRLCVIYAGVITNLIFGVLAFGLVFLQTGIPSVVERPRITEVFPHSSAQLAQIPVPVEILGFEVDDKMEGVSDIKSVQDFVANHSGQKVKLVTTGRCQKLECESVPQKFEIYVRTKEETPANEGQLGVVFDQTVLLFYPWHEMIYRSIYHGFSQAFFLSKLILETLSQNTGNIFKGEFKNELAGPIGIVDQVYSIKLFQFDWLTKISFAGMISVNLALMNFLPIPPLDGGKGLMTVLEFFIGRRRSLRLENVLSYGGYFILVGLLVAITAQDLWKIIGRVPAFFGWNV